MEDPNSVQAGVFRALMSRALFTIDPVEYEAAKQRLIARGRAEPRVVDIRREATSVIPGPDSLRSNVQAVFQFIFAKDLQVESKRLNRLVEDDNSPLPQRFLKSNHRLVRDTIKKQMKHVNGNCLSDPPDTVVNLRRYNPVTKKTYVARGTNTNERDNLDLATKILSATHIGKLICHRIGCCFLQ